MIVLIAVILTRSIIPVSCLDNNTPFLRWPLYHDLYNGILKSTDFFSDHQVNVSEIFSSISDNLTDVCDRFPAENLVANDSGTAFPSNYSVELDDLQINRSDPSTEMLKYILQRNDFMQLASTRIASIDCLSDLYYFAKSVRKMESWALKVADSFGKIPPGLYSGNVIWAGDYEECLEVDAPTVNITFHIGPVRSSHDAAFTGQYCLVQVISNRSPAPPVPQGYLLGGLTIGICTPKRCTEQELSGVVWEVGKIFNKTLSKAGLQLSGVNCPRKKDYLDSTGILAVIVVSVLLVLVVIGTSYEAIVLRSNSSVGAKGILDDIDVTLSEQNDTVTASADDRSLVNDATPTESGVLPRILTSFSLISNGKRLFSLSPKRLPAASYPGSSVDLACLHGIRFFSMAWIILGHTYYFSFAVSSNPLDRLDPNKRDFWFQAIIQAAYACDVFFVISACLVATQFFSIADQYPQVVGTCRFWITFYLQRFIRLTPPYMLILCVYVGLWKYVGNGPFWPEEGFEVNDCRRTWWSNLLYINNFINFKNPDNDGTPLKREYCAGWTWYLANDMQFYWLSPLVLYPFFKRRQNQRFAWLGCVTVAIFIIGGITITGIIARVNELPPNMFPAELSLRDKAQFMKDELYFKPYPHIPCYAVGLILALALRRHQNKGQQQGHRTIRKIVVYVGWSLSFSFAMAIIYGLWPEYRGHPFSADLSACYAATSRAVFSACVAWVAYACLTGRGGFVNKFLSWSLFKPLSRLTFCAYLIHPMLLFAYFFSRRTTFYYTEFVMVWFFGSFLIFTYLASIGVALVFESPFVTLNRRFVKRVE